MERKELLKLIKKGSITHNYLLDHAEELTKDEVVKEYVTQTGLDLEKDKDTTKEDTAKEDATKEDTTKEDTTKEDTATEKADIKVPDEDGIVVDPVASTPKKTRKTQNKK